MTFRGSVFLKRLWGRQFFHCKGQGSSQVGWRKFLWGNASAFKRSSTGDGCCHRLKDQRLQKPQSLHSSLLQVFSSPLLSHGYSKLQKSTKNNFDTVISQSLPDLQHFRFRWLNPPIPLFDIQNLSNCCRNQFHDLRVIFGLFFAIQPYSEPPCLWLAFLSRHALT